MSETLHAPYQRENRARWIITADMAAPAAPVGQRSVRAFGAGVRCAVVERGSADMCPVVQVSLRLYSDERRNSVIAFATRSGASNVRR